MQHLKPKEFYSSYYTHILILWEKSNHHRFIHRKTYLCYNNNGTTVCWNDPVCLEEAMYRAGICNKRKYSLVIYKENQ